MKKSLDYFIFMKYVEFPTQLFCNTAPWLDQLSILIQTRSILSKLKHYIRKFYLFKKNIVILREYCK